MGKEYKIRFGDSRKASRVPPRVITSLHALCAAGGIPRYILQYLRHLIIDRCTPQNDSRSIGTHDRNVYLYGARILEIQLQLYILLLLLLYHRQVHAGRIIYNIIQSHQERDIYNITHFNHFFFRQPEYHHGRLSSLSIKSPRAAAASAT